jgi:hypothetical protein
MPELTFGAQGAIRSLVVLQMVGEKDVRSDSLPPPKAALSWRYSVTNLSWNNCFARHVELF